MRLGQARSAELRGASYCSPGKTVTATGVFTPLALKKPPVSATAARTVAVAGAAARFVARVGAGRAVSAFAAAGRKIATAPVSAEAARRCRRADRIKDEDIERLLPGCF